MEINATSSSFVHLHPPFLSLVSALASGGGEEDGELDGDGDGDGDDDWDGAAAEIGPEVICFLRYDRADLFICTTLLGVLSKIAGGMIGGRTEANGTKDMVEVKQKAGVERVQRVATANWHGKS
jgi:hypothetical protein